MEINEINDENILDLVIQVAEAKKMELQLKYPTKVNKELFIDQQKVQQTKICTKCGETKPHSEYYKQKKAHDGLQTYCKSCHNKASIKCQNKRKALKQARKMMKE